MKDDRGLHLILKTLPRTVSELLISRRFFQTMGIDSSFLYIPTQEWHDSQSYKVANELVKSLPCVKDCDERGVALIENFNER